MQRLLLGEDSGAFGRTDLGRSAGILPALRKQETVGTMHLQAFNRLDLQVALQLQLRSCQSICLSNAFLACIRH